MTEFSPLPRGLGWRVLDQVLTAGLDGVPEVLPHCDPDTATEIERIAKIPLSTGPGTGIAECVRVRQVHADVRRHMLEQDDRELRRYGIPINVTDSAATLDAAFFIEIVVGVEKLGIRYSPSEKEALAHMWRWIGYATGVEDDLLPTPMSGQRGSQRRSSASTRGWTPAAVSSLTHCCDAGCPRSSASGRLISALWGRLTAPFTRDRGCRVSSRPDRCSLTATCPGRD